MPEVVSYLLFVLFMYAAMTSLEDLMCGLLRLYSIKVLWPRLLKEKTNKQEAVREFCEIISVSHSWRSWITNATEEDVKALGRWLGSRAK